MALTIRGSKQKNSPSNASADPTVGLAAAVKDFETILTNDQRLIFQGNYFKPQPEDVIAFVSRVDADNKGRARKCVAPRLCTFLESVVQFTGVVDTFVQSNPAIAALVWGSVKTAILAASNVASYFDKVTALVMQIGRMAPNLKSFGQLYPGFIGLQSALCEYYTIIVRLCIKIIEVSQRTSIVQILAPVLTPFETEFKPFIEEVSQAAKHIDIQVSLASKTAAQEEAKCAALERDKNAKHRRLMQRFQTDSRRELEDLRRKRILREQAKLLRSIGESLSSFDCISSWRQAKTKLTPGTAEWFKHDDNYCQWRSSPSSSSLWCWGKLGSGKSVFMSNVVSHLLASRTEKEMVSHLFCRFDEKETLDARKIMGSIFSQLLQFRLAQMKNSELEETLLKVQEFGGIQLTEYMISLSDDKMTYFVIIDGLDEIETHEMAILGRCLTLLVKGSHSTRFRVLTSSRQTSDSNSSLPLTPDYSIHLLGQPVDSDIERFVQTSLDQNLEDGKLILRDPKLIFKIVNALRQGANGMFLWARLLIDEICEQHSDTDILKALETLPKELSDIFDLKLARIRSSRASEKAIKLLQLCGTLREPLHLNQLRELIALQIGQTLLSEGELVNDMQRLVNACCGLLETDEETLSVRYVHFSVKQYLFSTSANGDEFNERLQDQHLGYLCLTYLNLMDFTTQLSKPPSQATNMKFTALDIGLAATRISAHHASIARHLLRHMRTGRHISTKDISNTLDGNAGKDNLDPNSKNFHFLSYARTNWIYHLKQPLKPGNLKIHEAFSSCILGSNRLADRPWLSVSDLPILREGSDWLIPARNELQSERELQAAWDWILANDIGSFVSREIALKLRLDRFRPDEAILLLRKVCLSGKQELFGLTMSLYWVIFEDIGVYTKLLGSILEVTVELDVDSTRDCLKSIMKLLQTHFSWGPFCLILRHVLHRHHFQAASLLLQCSEGPLLGLLSLRHILLQEAISLGNDPLVNMLVSENLHLNDTFDTVIYNLANTTFLDVNPLLLEALFPSIPGPEEIEVPEETLSIFLESCRIADGFRPVKWRDNEYPGKDQKPPSFLPLTADDTQLSVLRRGRAVPITVEHYALSEHSNLSPLVVATRCASRKYVELMLRLGARLEYPYTALEAAVTPLASSILPILLQDAGSNRRPIYQSRALHLAIMYSNTEACTSLLRHYYGVCRPAAPLHIAYDAVVRALGERNLLLVRALVASFDHWHETLLEISGWPGCTTQEMEAMSQNEIILQILSTVPFDRVNDGYYRRLETGFRLGGKIFELEA